MKDHFEMFAAYNRWANGVVYAAARELSEEELNRSQGAFFGSLIGTLNHLLCADRIWMKRFIGSGDAPTALNIILHPGLPELETARKEAGQVDIAFGIHLTRTLGQMDVGQAAVVQQGVALGVEAVEGTDALLERCRDLARKGQGGVLVKSCKPQPDRRLDLPAVGLTTVKKAYQAGLAGIAVEAGASFLLDREEVIEAADRLGLFIMGFRPL